MDTEKILARLNAKDYNNELENILEEKNFSETVKNLLLSMLYKIEAGYTDYVTVKRVVQNQKQYIETILSIIKEKIKKIEIIEEDTPIGKELMLTAKQYQIDKIERTITVLHPNEKKLLYAIYEIEDSQVYLPEEYNLIRVTLSQLLNIGENINNVEVLRDFNGWSWNTISTEIPEIEINLIYQNLIYLLGIEFIQELIHTNEVIDIIQRIQQKMEVLYGEKNTTLILKTIYQLSILIGTKENEREKNRLEEERKELKKELERLNNKSLLLSEISNQRKEARQQIKEIDSILSNKKQLEAEYIKRNETLPEYNKIFSISHLTEILTRQRKKIVTSMEQANRILEPNHYVQIKTKLEEQIGLLQYIDLPEKEYERKKQEKMIELQKGFLSCVEEQIKQVTTKEEILDILSIFRYYNLLYFNSQKQIRDIPELRKKQEKMLEKLLEKGQITKTMIKLSENNEIDNILWKQILESRFITLENLSIVVHIEDNSIEIYDTDILEQTIAIPIVDKKVILIKPNKKTKLLL